MTAEITRLETEIGHLVNAITQGGEAQALARAVTEREADLQTLRTELDDLEGADVETFTSLTDEALLDRLETVLLRLMGTSYEFADLLRELFAESYVVPVQTLDTGYARPRLVLRLNPAFVCGDLRHADVALDVFEPSAHLKVLEQVRVARTAVPPPSYARIARSLGVHLMTVKRAADYLRRMAARGTDTPYAVLHDPPDGDLSRWRRHRKPRRKAS